MKRCPKCRQSYSDETLNFCLEDGEWLVGDQMPGRAATRDLNYEAPTQLFGVDTIGSHSNSIAVLPFANLSSDTENEYFCDGLAEELMNALAKIENLKVAARTSAFSFKGKNTNASEIGTALSVRTILEGSVRKSDDRLRISVQLVNSSDGYQMWAETYERELRDIFDLQNEITLAVVDALKVTLLGGEKDEVLKQGTESVQAYHLYLQGRFVWNHRTESAIRRGIEFFNQAIVHDPNYAAAYAGLSDCYTLLVVREAITPDEGFPLGRANAEMALKIDPTFAEARASLGHAYLHYWHWEEADHALRKAIEQRPDYPSAHQWHSEFLTAMGRHDESTSELRLAAELDPLSLVISADLGRAYYYARQYEEVFRQETRTLELDPNFWLSHINLGRSRIQTGEHEQALVEFQKALEILPASTETLSFVGFAYAVSGASEPAVKILDQLKGAAADTHVPPYHFAIIYTGLGDHNRAFLALEKAYERHAVDLFTLAAEPMFDGLRGDARFADLVRRVGLPR